MKPVTSIIHSALFGPHMNSSPFDGEDIVREPLNPGIASIRNENGDGMRGIHRIPEHAELWRLGQQNPIVVNQLLRHEHVSYCMAWKRKVNPQSRPITVLHTACGPDLSTVLLTTNASRIIAVDRFVPTVAALNIFFNRWNTVDTDPTIAFDDARKAAMGWDNDPDGMWQTLLPPFKKMLEVRRTRGFWDDLDIMGSFVDRLTVIELKKMGVDFNRIWLNPSEVQPDQSQLLGETQLIFDWAYPGEGLRRRTIDYIRADVASLFSGELDTRIPPIEGLYQKARNGGGPENRSLVRDVQPLLLAGGFVLMGGSSGKGRSEINRRPDALQELGSEFQDLDVDQIYYYLMRDIDPYGWKLYGSLRLS